MIAAFIQARVSSSRLPGKVLKPILGRPMLELEIERVSSCKMIDRVVVVTSISPEDRAIINLCKRLDVDVFCGSLDNVLDRFYQAAVIYKPDHIVRLTGDCPLIDPEVVDNMIKLYLKGRYDYGTNCVPPTYPDGLDAEIFTFESLRQAHCEARLPSYLEHITTFFEEQPKRFKTVNLACERDLSGLRWTVDEPEDFKFVKIVFESLYSGKSLFSLKDVLELLKKNPELTLLNKKFTRNEGLKSSKEHDKAFLKRPLGLINKNKQDIVFVCFRVDANQKLGLGHLSRCRSLILALLKANKCNIFIISDDQEVIKRFLLGVDYKLFSRDQDLKNNYFDISIIDAPNIAESEVAGIRKRSTLVACIDDDGPGLECQDILIHPDLRKPIKSSKIKLSLGNYWSGRDYILLHPGFAFQSRKKMNGLSKVNKMLVCFGGSDPCGLTMRIVPLLKKLDTDILIHIVLGSEFGDKTKLMAILKDDRRFMVSQNVSNMAENMRNADIALISGGTMLYEACASGLPAIVISQNKAQEAEAKICHQAGAVINLGDCNSMPDKKIPAALKRVMQDAALRKKMSNNGHKLVPSKGAKRIVSKLMSRLKERRIQ